ncbi:MAG TPA: TerB family tellurite resistance protein [Polyangiaceae bacterium]|nr:TerB family tellurite resistance protein [Polyangiaceae bacterium]
MRDTDPAFVRDLGDQKIQALIEMMYLAATADGELSESEHRAFLKSAEDLTSRLITGKDLEALLERAKKDLEESGRDARLEAVKGRLPDAGARKLALSLAIQVTLADGVVRTSERELIMDTARALDIDGDTAADLVRDLAKG